MRRLPVQKAAKPPARSTSQRKPSARARSKSQRKWLPTVEVARQRYPHGTRARYCFGKCRCARCGKAIRDYERVRTARLKPPYWLKHVRGEWRIFRGDDRRRVLYASRSEDRARRKLGKLNAHFVPAPSTLVDAAPARKHITALQSQGVGLKTIAKAVPMAYSVLYRIHVGDVARTRQANLERILAVKRNAAVSGGALVRADGSVALIERLVRAGYRRGWIATQLGARTPALQVARTPYVTVRKARALRDLYVRTAAIDRRLPPLGSLEHALDAPAPARMRSGRAKSAVESVKARHGTRARYLTGCRCAPCARACGEVESAQAAAATRRVRYSLRGRGQGWVVIDTATLRTVYSATSRDDAAAVAEAFNVRDPIAAPNTKVDATPVREHVRALLATGLAPADVTAAAGVNSSLLGHLLAERNRRVTYRVASALLRVDAQETRPSRSWIDATPTWTLLDRLDAGGFRVGWVVDVLGLSQSAAGDRPRRIRLEFARAVRALYADIRERVPMVRALERGG